MKTTSIFLVTLVLLSIAVAQEAAPPASSTSPKGKVEGKPIHMQAAASEPAPSLAASLLYERIDPAPRPSDTPEKSPMMVRISQGVSEGLLKKKVQPHYPAEGRANRVQGMVVLEAVVDYDGKIKTLRLVSGHPMLVPAAVEAVKQWEYRPYFLNGHVIQVDTQITVKFVLGQ